jgi:uncharacterized protein (DUF2384 family)
MAFTSTRKEAARRKQKGRVRGRKTTEKGARRGQVPALLVGKIALPTKLFTNALIEASEVLGGRDEAMRWLGTPVRALGFATPISLLGTKDGAEQVHDVLTQVAHGVW